VARRSSGVFRRTTQPSLSSSFPISRVQPLREIISCSASGAIRGRIASLDFFVALLLMPLSMALAGPAGAVLGLTTVFIIAGLGPALVSLLVVYFGRMPSDEIANPLDQVEPAPTPA